MYVAVCALVYGERNTCRYAGVRLEAAERGLEPTQLSRGVVEPDQAGPAFSNQHLPCVRALLRLLPTSLHFSVTIVATPPPPHLSMNACGAHRYRAIICDECHALKNRTTQRAQKIGPLVRAADRAVLCTGTAILNRPIELFTQVGAGRGVQA